MLYTNLKHIESAADHKKIISENENVLICCGRMGVMSIAVYNILEDIRDKFPHVKFYDMEFDNPESRIIRNTPECEGFTDIPFLTYYNNGKLAKATSGIQSAMQIKALLKKEFGVAKTEKTEIHK